MSLNKLAKRERNMAKFCKPFLLPSEPTKAFDKKGEIHDFFGKGKNLIFKIFDKYLLKENYAKKPFNKQFNAEMVIKTPKPNVIEITVFHKTDDIEKSDEKRVLREFK